MNLLVERQEFLVTEQKVFGFPLKFSLVSVSKSANKARFVNPLTASVH